MCNRNTPPHFRIIPQLTEQHFYDMEALELQFYDAEFITPPEESLRWYGHHPHSTVAAECDGRLIGFVNLFPVQPEVYTALREGSFNDHFMELEHVAPLTTTPLHMFLCCVVVDKDYQRRGIARQLLRTAVQPYIGLPCLSVITDNVTPDGERLSKRLGFTHLCHSDHDSEIYEQEWTEFLSRVNN